MNATPTTTNTYQAPDGSIVRNVQFNPIKKTYSGLTDRGEIMWSSQEYFERVYTQILESETKAPTVITPTQEDGKTFIVVPFSEGQVSDGAHTFDELYEHRCLLFLAWCKAMHAINLHTINPCWMSRVHSDGSVWEGWFVAGVESDRGAITYHLPDRLWGLAVASGLAVVEMAPPYDGHNSVDVLARLLDVLAPGPGGDPIFAHDESHLLFAPAAVVQQRQGVMLDEKPADAWLDRLIGETRETAERLNGLNAFMGSDKFPTLPREDKDLLYEQQRAMSTYVQILGKRIERANGQFTHNR